MENACQWQIYCKDLQEQYNRLSNNAPVNHDSIESQLPLSEFEKELHHTIKCSEKSIILEKSPVPYVNEEEFPLKLRSALRVGVEDAVELCKQQLQDIAESMKQRDDALVTLICEQLRDNYEIFVFRGAGHQEYLSRLLNGRNIDFTPERFCLLPILEERVTAPLTIGKQVDETDVLRWVYVQVNRQNGDFEQLRLLMDKACALNEKQLRTELAALSDRFKSEG